MVDAVRCVAGGMEFPLAWYGQFDILNLPACRWRVISLHQRCQTPQTEGVEWAPRPKCRLSRSILSSYWRRHRTDRTIPVSTTTADIIRSGSPIAGTMNSQNGSPRATISQTI